MTISVELIDDRLLDSYAKLSELEARIKAASEVTAGTRHSDPACSPEFTEAVRGKGKESDRFTKGWTVKWQKK